MLRRLHNHIFACKLREVFDSPLVLVYQTLGHVDHLGLKAQLQAGLAKEPTVRGAAVNVCHMKNSVAAATGDDTLSRLFTNSNLLVGFNLPEQHPQKQQQLLHQQQQPQQQQEQQQPYQELLQAAMSSERAKKIRQAMSPQEAVSGLLGGPPQPGPHVPQPALKAFVETGAQLPSEQPLVLIGAFYKASATPLSRLKKWIKLDARQVSVTICVWSNGGGGLVCASSMLYGMPRSGPAADGTQADGCWERLTRSTVCQHTPSLTGCH